MEIIVLDVGETITRDNRYWHCWADWLGIPRHTLSALVGAAVAQGRDFADAARLARPDIDVAAEYCARKAAGRGVPGRDGSVRRCTTSPRGFK